MFEVNSNKNTSEAKIVDLSRPVEESTIIPPQSIDTRDQGSLVKDYSKDNLRRKKMNMEQCKSEVKQEYQRKVELLQKMSSQE